MTKKRSYNIFDILIVLSIFLLAGGAYGGALRPIRVFALILLPVLLFKVSKCSFIKNMVSTCVLFCFYCLISLVWTPDISEGINELVYFVIHFLLYFEIIILAFYSKKPLVSISTGWILLIAFCSIVAIWELTTGNHLSMAYEENNFIHDGQGMVVDRRVASVTFANFNSYCVVVCFALPWMYFRLVNGSISMCNKIVVIIFLAISMLVVLINGSRGAILTTLCMLAFFLFKYHRKTEKYLILTPFALVVGYFLIKYSEEIFMVISMRESLASEFGKNEGMSEGRVGIWLTALRAFLPTMGLGVGCGGMGAAMTAARTSTGVINMTHNMFIELLLQYGLIWFFVLIFFLIRLLKRTYKIMDEQISIPLKMALWLMPVYCIIDSTYLLEPILYVFIATIYIYTYHNHFENKKALLIMTRGCKNENNSNR